MYTLLNGCITHRFRHGIKFTCSLDKKKSGLLFLHMIMYHKSIVLREREREKERNAYACRERHSERWIRTESRYLKLQPTGFNESIGTEASRTIVHFIYICVCLIELKSRHLYKMLYNLSVMNDCSKSAWFSICTIHALRNEYYRTQKRPKGLHVCNLIVC